jgi:hypothetical protein
VDVLQNKRAAHRRSVSTHGTGVPVVSPLAESATGQPLGHIFLTLSTSCCNEHRLSAEHAVRKAVIKYQGKGFPSTQLFSIVFFFAILFNLAATCLGRTTIFKVEIYTSEINTTDNRLIEKTTDMLFF